MRIFTKSLGTCNLVRAFMVTSEEFVNLKIPHCPLKQGFLPKDLYDRGFHIHIDAYWYIDLRKNWFKCVNTHEVDDFQIYEGRLDIKILKNECFYRSKSLRFINAKRGSPVTCGKWKSPPPRGFDCTTL